jgi:hypothetical protein
MLILVLFTMSPKRECYRATPVDQAIRLAISDVKESNPTSELIGPREFFALGSYRFALARTLPPLASNDVLGRRERTDRDVIPVRISE